MPTMKGTVQEDDYRTEVRFKDKNLLKIKILASSGSQSTRIRKLRIRDSDPDLNPDLGLNRWHQSGGSSAARRWIRPGLRYHKSGLGRSTYVGTSPNRLPSPKMIGKENGQFTRIERKKQPHQRTHLGQRKIGPDCLLLLLLLYTFFQWSKASNLKEKSKRKKKGVRIQAIIGRIRTPDPDSGHFGPDFDSGSGLKSAFTDPSPGAALTHGLFGLFTDFLRTFRTRFRTVKIFLGVCVKRGGKASVKSGLK